MEKRRKKLDLGGTTHDEHELLWGEQVDEIVEDWKHDFVAMEEQQFRLHQEEGKEQQTYRDGAS